jgi:hypothetical protein
MLKSLGMGADDVKARTEAMTEALKKSGLRTTTLASDLRKPNGIAVALNDLNAHLKESGLNANASAALISRAFGGGRSGTAIMELVHNTEVVTDKYHQQGKVIDNYGRAWKQTQRTVQQQLKELEATTGEMAIKLGVLVIPTMNHMIGALRDTFDWLGKNEQAAKSLGIVFGGVLTVAMTAWFVSLGRRLGTAMKEVLMLGRGIAAIPGRLEGRIAGTSAVRTAASAAGAGGTLAAIESGPIGGLRSGFGRPGSPANPLVVTMLGAGLGGGVGGVAGGLARAEERVSPGGVILPPGVRSTVAVQSEQVAQTFMGSMRTAMGRAVGGLTRGAGIAGIGYMGAQLVGQGIGGHTGDKVASIGGTAAVGAGLGSFLGPEGTAAGAVVGALVGLLHGVGKDYTQKIADEATKGLGGAVHDSLAKQIAEDLQTVKDIRPHPHTPGSRGRGAHIDEDGNISGASERTTTTPITAEEIRKQRAAANRLGVNMGKAMEEGFAHYRFQNVDVMLADFTHRMSKLPLRSKQVASESMIEFARTLEKDGRLPKGATDDLIHKLEASYPGLKDFLARTGHESMKALAQTINTNDVQRAAENQVKKAGNTFALLSQVLAATGGDTRTQWAATMQYLESATKHGTAASRKAAKTELEAMVALSKKNAGQFATWMAVGTSTGTLNAAINLSALTKVFSVALGDIAGQTQDVSKAFGVKAVHYVAHHPKQVVATGLQLAAGAVGMLTRAEGGYVGSPGERGRDEVHAVVGRGEAIVNRHQQEPLQIGLAVSKAIGAQPFGSLGELFSGERRAHYMAKGGIAGGGQAQGSHMAKLIAAAGRVNSAEFPYHWGGGHEQPARFEPFDCSGVISYIVQQAGYKVPTVTSGNMSQWGFPSGPGPVTIFYNPTHTFARIGSRYFGTSGFARPNGGAGWFTQAPGSDYLSGFDTIHLPDIGGGGEVVAPKIKPAGGPLSQIANAASTRAAAAANQYLAKLSDRAGGGGGGGQALADGEGGNGSALMRSISKARRWAFDDWWELDRRETSHGANLTNPTSSARLRGQFLSMNYGKYGPGSDPAQHPTMSQQIQAMASYISSRYGDPTAALTHHRAYNWYESGGFAAAAGRPPERAQASPGGAVARAAAKTRNFDSRIRQHISSKRKKHKPRHKQPHDPIDRALAPFHNIPDVNHLPGGIAGITKHIDALSDQEGLLSTIAGSTRDYVVTPEDMDFLKPTLQGNQDIHAGMSIEDAQRSYTRLAAASTTTNPLLDLQGQLLDWAGQQPNHQLLSKGDIAILSTTFASAGIVPEAGQGVALAQILNLGSQADSMRHQVHVEKGAIEKINKAISERLERSKLVDKLAHSTKNRLDKIDKDLSKLKSKSLKDRLAAARDSAASSSRIYDAETERSQLGDLIAHERGRGEPDEGAIKGWEQRKRDLSEFIHGEHGPSSKSVTAAEVAIIRDRLENAKRPLHEDLHQLTGNTTQIGKSGMLGKITGEIDTLRGGRRDMNVDIAGILQSALPSTRLELRAIRDSLPPADRPVLAPDASSSDTGTNEALVELLREQNEGLARSFALSEAQSSVFAGIVPLIPRYDHGGLVANTGMALVHRGEWISPDPKGAYGSQLVAAPASSGGPSTLHVHLHGDAQHMIQRVETAVDERISHPRNVRTISAAVGRRKRMIVNAPGGGR